MSSEIKSTTVQTNSLKDKTGTRVLASDSGSAWSWGAGVPAGTIINYKFVQIGTFELSGSYDAFNLTSAATTSQGYQVISTSFTPKSTNSKIFCQAQLFVQEDNNQSDKAMSAIFVDTTNISQTGTQDRTIAGTDGYMEHSVATLSGEYTNNATSAKTITIRVSGNSNQAMNVNIRNEALVVHVDSYIKTGLSIFEIQA
jgi:hypothetical protein